MSSSHGGTTPSMYIIIIKDTGPFNSLSNIGYEQIMNFTKYDSGPFWMIPMDRLKSKYDYYRNESIIKEKIKVKLLVDLKKGES